jgi:predicted amino acid racemase
MLSQVDRVVQHADASLNSEPVVIAALSDAALACERVHGVVLMVELGDLREGILPADLTAAATATMALPGVELIGIGTNLACQSGVVPDERNMAELSALASSLEADLGRTLTIVSGGNSASLGWALGASDVGRVNHLRIGEAILLGCDPLDRTPIEGLRTDAFTLVAEVIEAKAKPSLAWGSLGETAFGHSRAPRRRSTGRRPGRARPTARDHGRRRQQRPPRARGRRRRTPDRQRGAVRSRLQRAPRRDDLALRVEDVRRRAGWSAWLNTSTTSSYRVATSRR